MSTEELQRIQNALSGCSDILLAILFGSLAQGRERADSDLDIAVAADRPLTATRRLELIQALAAATGRPVDLVDVAGVGEPLLGEILRHGKRLRGNDEIYARLLTRHLFDAADFLPLRDRILNERRKAWIAA